MLDAIATFCDPEVKFITCDWDKKKKNNSKIVNFVNRIYHLLKATIADVTKHNEILHALTQCYINLVNSMPAIL